MATGFPSWAHSYTHLVQVVLDRGFHSTLSDSPAHLCFRHSSAHTHTRKHTPTPEYTFTDHISLSPSPCSHPCSCTHMHICTQISALLQSLKHNLAHSPAEIPDGNEEMSTLGRQRLAKVMYQGREEWGNPNLMLGPAVCLGLTGCPLSLAQARPLGSWGLGRHRGMFLACADRGFHAPAGPGGACWAETWSWRLGRVPKGGSNVRTTSGWVSATDHISLIALLGSWSSPSSCPS